LTYLQLCSQYVTARVGNLIRLSSRDELELPKIKHQKSK